MMRLLLVAILTCTYWQPSFATFNILIVLPNVEYSDFRETSKLALLFSKLEYNVTVLSPFALPQSDHLTYLPISGDVELVKREKSKVYQTGYKRDHPWFKLKSDYEIGQAYLKLVVESDSFRELISSNDTRFDLVVLEDVGAFGLAVLSQIFKCPLVALLSDPLPPFYDNFVFDQFERTPIDSFRSAHYWLIKEFYREMFIFPEQNTLLKGVVPDGFDFIEALYNTRLILLPSYQSVGSLMPKYSHMKHIGGYNRGPLVESLIKQETNISSNKNDFQSDLITKKQPENIVVISTRLPEIVKNEIEKLEFPIPVKIVQWDVYQMAENQNIKLFIGDGNVYETDMVASMAIPIIRISENCWNQQFLADSLTRKAYILSASIKKKFALKTAINASLMDPVLFQRRLQVSSIIMQEEREHEKPLTNIVYWIEQVNLNQPFEARLDVQNKWLVIAIVLVIIDIILFILFYWIFKHITVDLFKICFGAILLLLIFLVKVLKEKLFRSSENDEGDKEKLCDNDLLEKSV